MDSNEKTWAQKVEEMGGLVLTLRYVTTPGEDRMIGDELKGEYVRTMMKNQIASFIGQRLQIAERPGVYPEGGREFTARVVVMPVKGEAFVEAKDGQTTEG